MATTNHLEVADTREEESPASALQLQLANGMVERLVEQNGGSDIANVFWDDDAFDSLEDGEEYVDPELWDPDEETLPEMEEIEWNIFECN